MRFIAYYDEIAQARRLTLTKALENKGVLHGKFNRKPAWSNNHILSIADPPKGWRDSSEKFHQKKDWKYLIPAGLNKAIPLGLLDVPAYRPITALFLVAGEEICAINAHYFGYFERTFPGCEWYIARPCYPVVVKQGKKAVGLVMPLSLDDEPRVTEKFKR